MDNRSIKKLEAEVGNNDAEVNSCRVRLELEQMWGKYHDKNKKR